MHRVRERELILRAGNSVCLRASGGSPPPVRYSRNLPTLGRLVNNRSRPADDELTARMKRVISPRLTAMNKRTTASNRIAAILMRKDAAVFYTRTPLQFLIALLAIVFVSETLVMFLLPVLFPKGANKAVEALTDAGLLTFIIFPAVWLLLVRPLRADAHCLADLNEELSTEVGARVELEQRLTRQALHDPLTGLPNRAFFLQELERTLARQQRQPWHRSTVLFIDLNRFKPVNDRFGHAAGDQVLVEVARRLEGAVRPGDIVARLGGDEFTVLLDNLEEAGHASKVAERILEQLRKPFSLQEPQTADGVQPHTVHISASIGIAGGEASYERAEALLHDADIAMYRAKAKGIGHFEIFAPAGQGAEEPANESTLR